jgi:hypothetical protein
MYQSKKANEQAQEQLEKQELAAKEEKAKLAQQEAKQEAWYQHERSIPTLEREENRAAMSVATEEAAEQNRKAESRMAIMGGSSEAAVAQRASNMKVIGGLARDIAASGAQYRQQLDSQYHGLTAQSSALRAQNNATSAKLSNAYIGMYKQQSANGSQLVSNGIQTFGNAATEAAKLEWGKQNPKAKVG